MYGLFKQLSLCAILSTLATQVYATPLASNERSILEEAYAAFKNARKRDVVAPPILQPDASTVWPIGTVQEVIWDTSKLPPDHQITNPIGRVILGRDTGDSLNLDLKNPLAEGFHIRQGRVNITVPSVIPRPDYLIVLMGNSGNTSPSFAITQIAGGGNNTSSRSLVPTSSSRIPEPGPSLPGIITTRSSELPILSSTTITDPIPISGTTITGSYPTSIEDGPSSPAASAPDASSEAVSVSTTGTADGPTPSDGSDDDGSGSAPQAKLSVALMLSALVGGLFLGY